MTKSATKKAASADTGTVTQDTTDAAVDKQGRPNPATKVGAMSGTRDSSASGDTPIGPTHGQPQVGPEDLQAQPVVDVAPRVATIVGNRQYASGEGFETGNTAPNDLWLDTESGEVVEDEPERGKLLARKGDIVQPSHAAAIAAYKAASGS